MKPIVFLSLFTSLFFCSCNRNAPKAPEAQQVGDFDSSVVAHDTAMQRTLESSYEYAKTLNVSGKLAYDIRAYGGPPSHGEYAILRRGADNKADTVVVGERFGTIVNAFTADLNGNGKEEIYIVTRRTEPYSTSQVVAYEFDEAGIKSDIIFGSSGQRNINSAISEDTLHPKSDTIVVIPKDHVLIKKYLQSNNSFLNHTYRLQGNKFGLLHYN